ncbi:phosphoglycerate dehydrogenase [Lipomyces starkeyi]
MTEKKIVLHIGDPIKYDLAKYAELFTDFEVIRPSAEEREREPFMKALKEKKWGDFHAIFRPTVKVFASAGAGYNWADVDVFAKYGIYYCNGGGASSEAVADMAIFHILSVFRNLTWSHLAARSGDPERWGDAHKPTNMASIAFQLGSVHQTQFSNADALCDHNRSGYRLHVGLGDVTEVDILIDQRLEVHTIAVLEYQQEPSNGGAHAGGAIVCELVRDGLLVEFNYSDLVQSELGIMQPEVPVDRVGELASLRNPGGLD